MLSSLRETLVYTAAGEILLDEVTFNMMLPVLNRHLLSTSRKNNVILTVLSLLALMLTGTHGQSKYYFRLFLKQFYYTPLLHTSQCGTFSPLDPIFHADVYSKYMSHLFHMTQGKSSYPYCQGYYSSRYTFCGALFQGTF